MAQPLQKKRRGAATVEFAVTAGVLFFFVFAALEFSRIYMIQNTASIAAYEGARRGLVPGSTHQRIEAAARKWLNDVALSDATVTISPSVITDTTPEVTVEVGVPLASNAWITPMFRSDMIISSQCSLKRERILVE